MPEVLCCETYSEVHRPDLLVAEAKIPSRTYLESGIYCSSAVQQYGKLRYSAIVKITEGRKLLAKKQNKKRFDTTVDTCLARFSDMKTIATGCAVVFMVLDGGENEVLDRKCVANARRPPPDIPINALPFDFLRRGR